MASDSFTDTDGTALATHDSNWAETDSGKPISNAEINGNILETVGTFDDASAYYSTSSEDFCQAKFVGNAGITNNSNRYVGVRASSGVLGYELRPYSPSTTGNWTRLSVYKNGAWQTNLKTDQNWDISTDHTFKLTATGTSSVTLEGFYDGVSQGTHVDSTATITSGSPSLRISSGNTVINSRIDDWTDLAGVEPADEDNSIFFSTNW